MLLILFLITLTRAVHAEPYRPLDHLWYGTRDTPNTENYIIFGIGTAATLGALAFDASVRNFFTGKNRMGSYDTFGNNVLGTGIPGAVIGATTLGYGLLWSKSHEINAGEAHLEALVATLAYTSAFKFSVRRPRPNGGSDSFPSGHTSTTFTSAASLMDMYGPAAGIPALVLATYTGVCRLSANAHYLSDVLFGATLGYVVGHAYAMHHQNQTNASNVTITPLFDDWKNLGLMAQIRW